VVSAAKVKTIRALILADLSFGRYCQVRRDPGISPDIFPRTYSISFLHGVGHSAFHHHHHPPIYNV